MRDVIMGDGEEEEYGCYGDNNEDNEDEEWDD